MNDYKPLLSAIERYLEKADNDLEEQLREEGRAIPKETVEVINDLEEELASALKSQTQYYVNEIKKKKTLADVLNTFEEIKAADICDDAIKIACYNKLSEFVPKLASAYMAKVDSGLKIYKLTKRTTNWVTAWSGQLADMMKLPTPTAIENIIKHGLESGVGIEEVTRQIIDAGIRNERYRARAAALTEILRAHGVAQHEAFMLNPSVKGKIWRHTGNYRNEPRENHVNINGQRRPKEQTFELVGADGELYYPMFPLDPDLPASESVNCHCLCEPDVDEKILVLPLDERQRLVNEARAELDDAWEKELDAQNRARAGIEE